MRLPAPLRLVLSVVFVAAATGLLWWLVGFQIGKGMLSGSDATAFQKAYAFDEGPVLRLVFLALVGAITVAAAGGAKWLPLAGMAFGAALLSPDRGLGGLVGIILFVLCVAGIAEMGAGARALAVGAIAAIAVSIAFTMEGPFGRSEIAVVAALRAIFWFLPLFVLPDYVDRYALKKLGV